jgi:DNA-binding NarL/FixJ family response regulator
MLNIAIIEDNAQYRTTLSIILQLNENFRLIHKLDSCDEMIGLFEAETPDVVLMDIDLPGMDGIQAVWEIRKLFPEMKVIMLTVFEDDEKIFNAIRAGANGYLLKKDSPQKILEAIEAVVNGEWPMNGMIAARILDCFQQMQKRNSAFEELNLTSREKEILSLLIKGYSYKEIAAALFISVETLNSHIKNIYRKLDVHSRSELAAKYGNSI